MRSGQRPSVRTPFGNHPGNVTPLSRHRPATVQATSRHCPGNIQPLSPARPIIEIIEIIENGPRTIIEIIERIENGLGIIEMMENATPKL